MNSKALAVLVLAVVAAAAWFLFRSAEEVVPVPQAHGAALPAARNETGSASAAVGAGTIDRPKDTADAAAPARSAAEIDAKGAAAPANVRGRLVDAAGKPRSGVALLLSTWEAPDLPGLDDLSLPPPGGSEGKRPGIVTKDDGTFALSIAQGRHGSVDLADADLVFVADPPRFSGNKGDQDLGDVVAVRSGALQGVVRDERGQPVPGVRVTATLGLFAFGTVSESKTDANGAFAVGKLRGGAWTLRTASDRFLPTVQEFELKAEERRADITLVVHAGRVIAGQVVDDLGVPVAGCKVAAKRREVRGGMDVERFDAGEAATTDRGGYFTLAGLSGASATVRAFDKSHTAAVAKDVAVGTGNLVLRVTRLAEIAGVVVDAAGTPIVGSRVRARPARGGDFVARDFDEIGPAGMEAARTEADGSFRLTGVTPGQIVLVAQGETHLPSRSTPLEVVPGAAVKGVRLVAQPGATAKVEVKDAAGKPVAGASVSVRRPGSGGSGGAFAAHSVEATIDADGERDVAFDMPGGEGRFGSAKTGADGVAFVKGLPSGAAVVVATHAEHAASEPLPLQLPAAGVVEASVTLRKPGFVEVHVVGADGAPVADCPVTVREKENEFGGHDERTDARGVTRIGPLDPGAYVAQLSRAQAVVTSGNAMMMLGGNDAIGGTKREFEIVAGETTQVEIVRPLLARLYGTVTGVDGPVVGCVVELEGPGERPDIPGFGTHSARAGDDGTFSIADVESGKYVIHYGKASSTVKSSLEVVVPANTSEVRQDLVVRTGKLRVQACAKGSGEPIEGARVELARASEDTGGAKRVERSIAMIAIAGDEEGGGATMMTMGSTSVLTGADGWAEVDDVPEGVFDVRVTHDGCVAAERKKQAVAARQTTDCGRVDLSRAGQARGTVVEPDGSATSMAVVQHRAADEQEWDQHEFAMGGAFTIKSLAPGRHLLRAHRIGPDGPAKTGPEVEIEVKAGETVTAEVRLPPN